jgi:hypothetical protein
MSSKPSKNGAHDEMGNGEDILGGPDRTGREDVLSAPGREPHPGMDILGGPDGAGPEDEPTAPGRAPAIPAQHDVLGGPDPADREDILGPHAED